MLQIFPAIPPGYVFLYNEKHIIILLKDVFCARDGKKNQ